MVGFTTIADACELVTDGTHYTPKNVGSGIPFLTVKDVSDAELDFKGCSFITDEDYKSAKDGNSAPKFGDVLFSKDGTVGKVHVVAADRPFAVLSSLAILRPKAGVVDAQYLGHALRSPAALDEALKKKTGSAIRRIILSDLKKVRFPLPSLSEQRRIATMLDQANVLRAKRRETLTQLDELQQAIFIEMFGASPYGNPIWEEVKLEDVTETLTGFAFRSEDYVEESPKAIRLCRGANVLPGRIDWSNTAWWPADAISGLKAFELVAGDIVLAMDRPWISEGFKITRISEHDCPCLLVQRVTRIRGGKQADTTFIYHLLRQPAFIRHCKPTETTVPHISPKDIRSYKFHLPPLSIQAEFCRKIATLEELFAKSSRALESIDELFFSLQHRAFRGEL